MAQHHDHGHGHDHDEFPVYGNLKDYKVGFILSVILTVIPFWLVMAKVLPSQATAYIIIGFAAVQFVVHMVYFLHMNGKSEKGWNMMAFVLTIVLLFIVLAGSIWVMYHMNNHMMPTMDAGNAAVHGTHEMP